MEKSVEVFFIWPIDRLMIMTDRIAVSDWPLLALNTYIWVWEREREIKTTINSRDILAMHFLANPSLSDWLHTIRNMKDLVFQGKC